MRLSPDAFWRMTPRELALALRARGFGLAVPIDRTAFDDLMRRHPDG
ncbi:rcc01693 family protein [Rhodoplanes azumiensis]|uniref:Rcc01693 family protein n=1 Tax=Rhodoplanes azumiensis TaxID=1897628 RepID=A0ABW5AG76_9BRAD